MSVSEILNLPNAEQQKEMVQVLQAISNGVSDIAGKKRPFTEIREWRTIQALVRLGLAPQFFKVGDQLQCKHEIYGTLVWDILDFDYDIPVDANGNYLTTVKADGSVIPMHSLTLQLHDCINTQYQWHRTYVNVWQSSDIRAWLNTDQTISDFSGNAGFLYGIDEDLLEVVGTVAKTTAINEKSGGRASVLTEKFFLPSLAEVFGGDNKSYREGAIFLSKDTTIDLNKFYCTKDTATGIITKITSTNITDDSNPSALGWYEVKGVYDYYGPERSDLLNPGSGADTNRKKKFGTDFASWWLRSPNTSYTNYACCITPSGNWTSCPTYSICAVAPCCVIV